MKNKHKPLIRLRNILHYKLTDAFTCADCGCDIYIINPIKKSKNINFISIIFTLTIFHLIKDLTKTKFLSYLTELTGKAGNIIYIAICVILIIILVFLMYAIVLYCALKTIKYSEER